MADPSPITLDELRGLRDALLRARLNGTRIVKLAVAAVTGRVPQRYGALAAVRNLVFAGNIVLMPWSVFSSLAEPLTAGVRSTYLRDSVRALTTNLSTLVRSGRREELAELGRVIGLVNNALRDGYMENRTNADSMGMSRTWSVLLARFYQANLLSPLTNFQRIAMQPVAHAIIMRHLRTMIEGGRNQRFADGELNELGIGAEDRADLLAWLDRLDGLPTPDDLLAPDGDFYNRAGSLWASAVVRLTDSIIQNPQKADRPMLADDPTYAALYAITSFISAFQRNIINRTLMRHLAEKETILGKGTRAFQNLLVAAPPVACFLPGSS